MLIITKIALRKKLIKQEFFFFAQMNFVTIKYLKRNQFIEKLKND